MEFNDILYWGLWGFFFNPLPANVENMVSYE